MKRNKPLPPLFSGLRPAWWAGVRAAVILLLFARTRAPAQSPRAAPGTPPTTVGRTPAAEADGGGGGGTRRSTGYSVESIAPWSEDEGGAVFPGRFPALERHLLNLQVPLDGPPSYVDRDYQPQIESRHPLDSPREAGIKRLVHEEVFRQVRARLKRYWRQEFQTIPNISYDVFEDRIFAINQIGRDQDSFENGEYYAARSRDTVLRRKLEGENEVRVVELGPLSLLDSGSLSLDTSVFKHVFQPGETSQQVLIGSGDEPREPLVSGKNYRVHTGFRLEVNPLNMKGGSPLDVFKTYGMSVDITWLSDVLKRERFTTEFEAQRSSDGDAAFFCNFVLKTF